MRLSVWLVVGSVLLVNVLLLVKGNELEALNDMELRRFVRKLVRAALLEAADAKVGLNKKCGLKRRHRNKALAGGDDDCLDDPPIQPLPPLPPQPQPQPMREPPVQPPQPPLKQPPQIEPPVQPPQQPPPIPN